MSFRIDEDGFALLDALARQTSYSSGEVLRRCLTGIELKSTIDAQALTEVSRVHADLNRIGGLRKLPIREGVPDPSSYRRLNLELVDSVIQVRRAVERFEQPGSTRPTDERTCQLEVVGPHHARKGEQGVPSSRAVQTPSRCQVSRP